MTVREKLLKNACEKFTFEIHEYSQGLERWKGKYGKSIQRAYTKIEKEIGAKMAFDIISNNLTTKTKQLNRLGYVKYITFLGDVVEIDTRSQYDRDWIYINGI